jgi:hypothetical protein
VQNAINDRTGAERGSFGATIDGELVRKIACVAIDRLWA